jgi:putative membrane protein
MMWGYSLNWPGMTLMMLGSTLWILFIVALAWAVIRWLNTRTTLQTRTMSNDPTARDILNQRYARGEIDTATFEQMRERLEASTNIH